jgi:hypothetical protein
MNPKHSQWEQFAEEVRGLPMNQCDSQTLTMTEKVLKKFEGVDVPASLNMFRRCGGYCDCEMLFNVLPIMEQSNG